MFLSPFWTVSHFTILSTQTFSMLSFSCNAIIRRSGNRMFFFFFLSSLYSGKTSIPLIWQIEHFRKRGMNIGLIQLRFDILTVIIVCFVFIEVTLIIYSVFFRKSMHSEAPVSAFQSSSCSLSIACCFLYFFFFYS